jgi:hypothetical protein
MRDYFSYEDTDEMIRVSDVEALDGYLLKIKFSNGKLKLFDFKPFLEKPVFAPLKDKNFFAKANIKYNTVVWNDKIDFDAESLYWNSEP